MNAFDPDAYIRSAVAAGRTTREIARDIGCERLDIYRRTRTIGLHGRRSVLKPHQEKAVRTLVEDFGRPGNRLHAILIEVLGEAVLSAECHTQAETERTTIAVSSALNRLVSHPDVSVRLKDVS